MKKQKFPAVPAFTILPYEMLNSKAFIELPYASGKMLPYFLGKVKKHYNDPSRYQTAFSFSFSEALRYGCAKATFSAVVKSLMLHGFIDPVSKGGLRGGGLSVSMFKLSFRWRLYKLHGFQEIRWECFGA